MKLNETRWHFITNLTTIAALDDKINEVKNKITNITNLAINNALSVFKNKILNHSKYITTLRFTPKLKQANLTPKSDIADFVEGQISMIN